MQRTLFVGLLAIAPLSLSAQSPWARSKAGFYAQLGFQTIPTYGTLFGKDGDDIEMVRLVSESTLQFYGEYGISDRTTVVASLPFRFNKRGADNPNQMLSFAVEDTGSISGLGNASIAVRHQILTGGPVALAGTLRVDLPAGAGQPNAGLRTGFEALTIQPTLSVGMGFGKFYWFAYGGYAVRTNDYSHYVNGGAEAGAAVGPVWISAFTDLVVSTENGSRKVTPFDGLTGLYDNNQGWLSMGLKANWQVNRFFGVSASATGAAWAQYVPKKPALSAAVFFKWD